MRATTPRPQLTFADLEFLQQGVCLDPNLQAISQFLDQHAAIIELVRQDLLRGLQKPHTGRAGIDAPRVLRSVILMRVKNWDYRELRERIHDGYTLRRFTRFDADPVPKHDAFHRAFQRLTRRAQPPAFWDQVADHLRTVPGVETVALAGWPLLSGTGWNSFIWVNSAPTEVWPTFWVSRPAGQKQ